MSAAVPDQSAGVISLAPVARDPRTLARAAKLLADARELLEAYRPIQTLPPLSSAGEDFDGNLSKLRAALAHSILFSGFVLSQIREGEAVRAMP